MLPRVRTTSAKDEAAARHAIYDDVEGLLVPGFLSEGVEVAHQRLVLRSLYPGDLFVLRNRLGSRQPERAWREWAVATSVWMVDGQVLLGDVNAACRIQKMLRSAPSAVMDSLFSVYVALHNRVRTAMSRLEAFCYEDYGRTYWRMVGRGAPSKVEVAGISGVSELGMNHLQRLWVAFNLAEDDRQTWNLEWAAAKLVASATSPKGVRRLSQRDEGERKLEEERRKKVIQQAYYEVTGRHVGETGGMVVFRSVTPEELVDEMARYARGERDLHDQVIESYKNRIREKHEEDRVRHAARMHALSQLRAESGQVGASVVGYTAEQMRALQAEMGAPARKGVRVVDAAHNVRVYDKVVARETVVGGISDAGKGVPLPSEKQESGNLTDLVSGRRVQFGEGSY